MIDISTKSKGGFSIMVFTVILTGALAYTFISTQNFSLEHLPTYITDTSVIIGPISDEQLKQLILSNHADQYGFFSDVNFVEYYSVNYDEQHIQRIQFLTDIDSYSINYECTSLDNAFENVLITNIEFEKLNECLKDNFCKDFKHTSYDDPTSTYP